MFILLATAKLRHRIGASAQQASEQSTTTLGDWYPTTLRWRPQVALLLNERTLLGTGWQSGAYYYKRRPVRRETRMRSTLISPVGSGNAAKNCSWDVA